MTTSEMFQATLSRRTLKTHNDRIRWFVKLYVHSEKEKLTDPKTFRISEPIQQSLFSEIIQYFHVSEQWLRSMAFELFRGL